MAFDSGGGTGNTDQIYLNRALTSGELDRISFYSDFGNGILGSGFQYEAIPVPEPEAWAAAAFMLLGGPSGSCATEKESRENPSGVVQESRL